MMDKTTKSEFLLYSIMSILIVCIWSILPLTTEVSNDVREAYQTCATVLILSGVIFETFDKVSTIWNRNYKLNETYKHIIDGTGATILVLGLLSEIIVIPLMFGRDQISFYLKLFASIYFIMCCVVPLIIAYFRLSRAIVADGAMKSSTDTTSLEI